MRAGMDSDAHGPRRGLRRAKATVGVAAVGVVLTLALAAGAGTAGRSFADVHATKTFWHTAALASTKDARLSPAFHLTGKVGSFELDRSSLKKVLALAPRERTRAARVNPLIVSLPLPNGTFQRFTLEQSDVMAPGLARKHPEIKTYTGRGIDDAGATIHADLSPIGFHASVRSAGGAWYIDPYYHLSDRLYVSYRGAQLKDTDGPFVERDAEGSELSFDRGYYHAADTVELHGSEFEHNATITITISDPEEHFASRTLTAQSDELGAFDATFVADPNGNLETHVVGATDGVGSAGSSYQVVRDDDPTVDPPTGDVLRTYRLALITDPGYAAYSGGSANVTAAKVALMNRVDQVYRDDLSIHLQLVANNDLLNLDTWDAATAPNGPCGAAACFTQSQVTGCSSTTRARFVIGQIIGASNYDIGHLALGQPGGGVANLGVIGRSNKAGGCTGIPTPVGDFYAIDYVAHEMGHQFSGNHPFNGNQLNCSGGNRNASTSVEVGSGSSIMAYAGICLTDDLQPHSDPYFSQRSQQEITTYVSSNQAAINEVQTAALRHFGGGNEVQVVTFGPGYAPTSTVQPLSLAINAAPSATSRGGAEENGNTVTIATGNPHTLQVGDTVTLAGVGVAGYNGTWTVTAVPTSRSFQFTNPAAGLATSGGGTVTLNAPGATESGNTVTISTSLQHNRSVGDIVTITGANPAGYNGTVTITAVPTARTFQYTAAASGLANGGAGTVTFFSPFRVRIGGNDSTLIGGTGAAYTNANIQSAINAIAGFAGTATVAGAASTGFTVTYGGAAAGLDVPNFQLVNLGCTCFGSVEETNHGGANDSFTLNYNGNVSAPITNGVNFTAAGILTALTPLLPAGGTVAVAGFAGGAFNNTGFQLTFTGTLAATNVPVMVALQDFTAGASGFVNETDKGGAVDNKGIVTPTGNAIPSVTAPAQFTIPLRTPFALTGSATDADGNALLYSWEQNDRGGAAGTSLLSNTKTNGPLFAMFPKSGQISAEATLLYDSPGENHLTANPTRVFPDLQQILDNNTNADTGACTTGPIAPQASIEVKECFSEFLPTADYLGFAGTNAAPLSLHFRLTARDGRGGNSSADTTLLLAPTAGPFLVTSPNAALTAAGASAQTVTWSVANTNLPPIGTDNVKISLSTDGGQTFTHVLAASTPNDGSESVTLPNVGTTRARIKIEAVGNVFFDISNASFTIQALPAATNSLAGGNQSVAYGDALVPDVTVTGTDADTVGTALTAAAVGLPAGTSLATTSANATTPGSRTWKVAGNVTAPPGTYPVSVTITDDTSGTATTSFTIVVVQRALTIAANARDKAYGAALSLGSSAFTATGLAAGDGIAGATLTSVGSPAAAGAGNYVIAISAALPQAGTDLANYAITYVTGTLSVYATGVIGLDSVTANGNTVIDSFDSTAGAYGPANNGSAARLISNGAISLTGKAKVAGGARSAAGSVTLNGSSAVTGNVDAGGTISNSGTIGGVATAHSSAAPIDAPAVAACSPFTSPADPVTGDLTVSGGKTVTLANGTYCFHDLTLSGNSELRVTGPVVIRLTGQLKASGGTFANPTNVPANLQISSSYAGKDGVSLSGGSGAYLTVYAPKTGVTISGNAPLYGAVLGKTLTLSGNASVHYDVRLLTVWASQFGI